MITQFNPRRRPRVERGGQPIDGLKDVLVTVKKVLHAEKFDPLDRKRKNFNIFFSAKAMNFSWLIRSSNRQISIRFSLLKLPTSTSPHALAIQEAARKGGIQVLVNYETTWYASNQEAYSLVHDQKSIGNIRKVVVHDGHRGPKEIGCSADFLNWPTDPVLNGGGALMDFGCYGADLITWLMDSEKPSSVFAVTQRIKPDVYPKVEDEATIVLTYPSTQGIIQASWNWPFDRKDMEIYGQSGYVLVPRRDLIKVRAGNASESERSATPLQRPQSDPLSYLAAVVRGEIKPSGLSSLEINMIVTEILDAARESARTGKQVYLK